MKKTPAPKTRKTAVRDMRREYRLDYSKARPNRFAGRSPGERLVVVLDPDIAQVFTTPESVNVRDRKTADGCPDGCASYAS